MTEAKGEGYCCILANEEVNAREILRMIVIREVYAEFCTDTRDIAYLASIWYRMSANVC